MNDNTFKTKSDLIRSTLLNYEHDYDAEGDAISKRRLWYIIRPIYAKLPTYKKEKVEYYRDITNYGKPVKIVTSAEQSAYFNNLAKADLLDDTYISDNSRIMKVGERLPYIVIAVEKSTVDKAVLALAEHLGCSCYIAKGFSSIYAAKKLMGMMEEDEQYQIEAEINWVNELEYTQYPWDERAIKTPLIVLNMTDYDKSGLEIHNTIAKHFNADEAHRVLLKPEQIPIDKIDEYFKTDDKKVGKAYELDVLNIHQLEKIFLDNIPQHIADIITEKDRNDDWLSLGDRQIPRLVSKDERIMQITAEIDDKQAEIDEVQSTYKQQIEELEMAMAEATEELDDSMEELRLNQHTTSIEILPEVRENYFMRDNPIDDITVHEMVDIYK